jgi:uncharacterized protein (UPF0548 family)
VLGLAEGLHGSLPPGFDHDFSQSNLGRREDVFVRARQAMKEWTEFDLGWVEVADRSTPIACGRVVGVVARAGGLWSVNISRIVETVDTPSRFGFLYSTTSEHVERGEERFLIEHDGTSGNVTYLLEAVSHPRNPLARLAYPYVRAMQRRFARDSHGRMRRH